jgi:hypothetical protein
MTEKMQSILLFWISLRIDSWKKSQEDSVRFLKNYPALSRPETQINAGPTITR